MKPSTWRCKTDDLTDQVVGIRPTRVDQEVVAVLLAGLKGTGLDRGDVVILVLWIRSFIQHSNQKGTITGKLSRRQVRPVIQGFGCGNDFVARLGANVGLLVENPGDGLDRDPRELCDIVDRRTLRNHRDSSIGATGANLGELRIGTIRTSCVLTEIYEKLSMSLSKIDSVVSFLDSVVNLCVRFGSVNDRFWQPSIGFGPPRSGGKAYDGRKVSASRSRSRRSVSRQR